MKNLIANITLSICLSSASLAFSEEALDINAQTLNNTILATMIGDVVNLSDQQIEEMAILQESTKHKNNDSLKKHNPSMTSHNNTHEENFAALLSQQEHITKRLTSIDRANLKQEARIHLQIENILNQEQLETLHKLNENKFVSNTNEYTIYDV